MRSKLLIVFLVVFIDLLGFGIIIPILPYYADSFGASAYDVGMLMVCYSAMQFLFSPLWGSLSDKVGRRPVMLFCLVGMMLSLVVLGFAPSLMWLYIARIFSGIFGANVSTASAYIADVTTIEDRAKGMGLIGAAFGLGFLVGPAVGGMLSKWGYGTAAFAAAIFSGLSFLFALWKLKEPQLSMEERAAHRRRFGFRDWIATFTHPTTGLAIWMFFLVTSGHAIIETIFGLFLLKQFGMDAFQAGLLLALMAVVMVTVQGKGIGPLSKKFGEVKLLVFGTSAMTAALFLASFGKSYSFFVAAILLHALGYAVTNPSLMSQVSKYSPESSKGATMGIYQSAGSLARIAGPLSAGLLFDVYGPYSPFLAACVLFFLAFLLLNVKKRVWKAALAQ
ncbi:MAG: tetracycline resistance MFS efflux pump [Deltaproteobacteria bacterium CG_4_10_14_0_2_um_filter_43_8]|nr:MAG: tetracycline resistance MFS efflux pump [Deltaproteobacteria bacterium CG11_big_fil_rev_8_21_14_0_20_42_23]PJA18142.1 MAG: tetracycline resistance MFS efflux pump [Deltaproteobacteria bacterium CG_4_10_14_0_2_um_filter_43_8]PJC65206.1 MAG: tetracycline resistance MFS efflux pump [Deltaproteobacteria bacterium CG_4_9_14_0_2_um_filter_42_21]